MMAERQHPNNIMESGFEDILALILARSRGEIENEVVENALSSIIPVPDKVNAPMTSIEQDGSSRKQDVIIADTDNYDDDNNDQRPNKNHKTVSQASGSLARKKETRLSRLAYDEALERIPLGKMGKGMLVTFGDGPNPHPDVVSATLLGARSCLQQAILDARALHRRTKDQWHRARAALLHTAVETKDNVTPTSGAISTSNQMDSELSFRAMDGHDRMGYKCPCGFTIQELARLFPEEMGAYQRWKQMHKAYTQNSSDPMKTSDNFDDDEVPYEKHNLDDETLFEDTARNQSDLHCTGHLFQRLSNFDVRTCQMANETYMKFSDVRRGSFLPRKKEKTLASKEWIKQQKLSRRKGRQPVRTTWQSLHPSSVIFLHWIGFDTKSSLPPPNEETTQALGFLAHDFFGKIVEKAVAKRLESSIEKNITKSSILPELIGGDQLVVENIHQALSEINLKPLYSSSGVNIGEESDVAQLYFGPGFEDRLELELEEIFGSKEKSLTHEELKTRQEEENLFSSIADPPILLDKLTDILDVSPKNIDSSNNPTTTAKRKRNHSDG